VGRWMEVVRRQPPQGHRHHDQAYEELIVREIAPHPLMHAFGAPCQANAGKREVIQKSFPALEAVGLGSPRYTDEDLWLNADELGQLLEEIRRLRRVCRRGEYIPGIDGAASYETWRNSDRPEDFDSGLDRIEAILVDAHRSGYWVRLMV
jgi:hypothetical protein